MSTETTLKYIDQSLSRVNQKSLREQLGAAEYAQLLIALKAPRPTDTRQMSLTESVALRKAGAA